MDELQRLLDQFLLEGDTFDHGQMWANIHIGDAWAAGTQKANSELSSLSNLYAEQRPMAASCIASHTLVACNWRILKGTQTGLG